MGKVDTPLDRAHGAERFVGWYMVNIINHFKKERNLDEMFTMMEFRRALLVSREATMLVEGKFIQW